MTTTTAPHTLNCRCFMCRVARSNWERERVQAARDGVPYTTTCEQSAARLELFLAAGFTYKAIGRPMGMDGREVQRIVENPHGTMLRSTQEKIMNLQVSQIDPGKVTALGSMRRLRDLSLLGWRLPRIAEESGLSENAIRNVALGRVEIIMGTTAKAITNTHDRLSRMDPPADPRSRSWAKKSRTRGWSRLAAYNDPDNDKRRNCR